MNSNSDMSNKKLKRKHIRLRGGFNVLGNVQSLMVTKAIESARRHGAKLIQGKLNQADGNCAFESVINNVNLRDCFQTKLPFSPLTYRVQWMTNLQNQESRYPLLGAGYTVEEKRENWDRLKQSGVYEIDHFWRLCYSWNCSRVQKKYFNIQHKQSSC